MDIIDIILIAVGLAMDAAAVSMVAAAMGYAKGPRAKFRLSFHFGLFQFLMPIIGWFLGRGVVHYTAVIGHWIAFALVTFVGVRMIRSGIHPESHQLKQDPSKGMTMVMLSVATSLDALAIGLSLAMMQVNIWYASAIIGLVTASLSLISIRLGSRLGVIFGHRIEMVGGGILVAIGFRIILSHLLN